jgi:hypothetical protein
VSNKTEFLFTEGYRNSIFLRLKVNLRTKKTAHKVKTRKTTDASADERTLLRAGGSGKIFCSTNHHKTPLERTLTAARFAPKISSPTSAIIQQNERGKKNEKLKYTAAGAARTEGTWLKFPLFNCWSKQERERESDEGLGSLCVCDLA